MRVYILCAIILALFFAAGSMSLDDAVGESEHYTDMFCSGVWPDYRDLKPDCPTPGPARPNQY